MKADTDLERAILALHEAGRSDAEVAAATGSTANHSWAVRVALGGRKATAAQLAIAERVIARKRQPAPEPKPAKKAPRPRAKSKAFDIADAIVEAAKSDGAVVVAIGDAKPKKARKPKPESRVASRGPRQPKK